MPRNMLSMHRGLPIAKVLDKKGGELHTIFITEEEEKPDIEVDNPEELIDDEDISKLRSLMKIGNIELKLLRKALLSSKDDVESKFRLNEKMKTALKILLELAQTKLKTEINFEKDKEVGGVIPFIGGDANFDRSIFICGASGAGKSFLAKQICKLDAKKRPIILFSKVENDPSLIELEKLKTPKDGKSRLIKIRVENEMDLFNLPTEEELKDCICLFDDIDSLPDPLAEFVQGYRDILLTTGRHKNITVISTSHQLFNWSKTRTLLNEAELIGLFPNSNKRASIAFLKDRLGIPTADRMPIINKCMIAGRFMCVKVSAPNTIIHNKGVMML